MGIPWINILFHHFKNKQKKSIVPFRPLIQEYVLCCECKNKIARAKLNKLNYTYACHYGHEVSVEHYNFHFNKFYDKETN